MTWESVDWQPAGPESLGEGSAILEFWPMIQSGIGEAFSAEAMAAVTVGELRVGHIDAAATPAPLVAARSVELLGSGRRGSWAAFETTGGETLGGKPLTAARAQDLVLDGLDQTFEALLGEGMGLGEPLPLPAPDTALLLLRLPLTSTAGEELVLISAYDASIATELAAHVNALQVLSAEPAPGDAAVGLAPAAATEPAPTPATPNPAAPAPSAAAPSQFAAAPSAPVPSPAPPAAAVPARPAANVRPVQLAELSPAQSTAASYNLDLLLGVNLQVSVEIGRTNLLIRNVLALTPGSIVELDKLAGEKVDVLVNGRQVAQGEVVVVDDNFGVRITDVVSRQQRLAPAAGR